MKRLASTGSRLSAQAKYKQNPAAAAVGYAAATGFLHSVSVFSLPAAVNSSPPRGSTLRASARQSPLALHQSTAAARAAPTYRPRLGSAGPSETPVGRSYSAAPALFPSC